ncbi:MAG TPA: 50S ribosomal protein P1 [Nitrososphaerales archaeon]
MEYVYAALLLHKLKKEVNEENVKKIIKAAGTEPDEIRTKSLIAALAEVNIDEALKNAIAAPVAAAPVAQTESVGKKSTQKEEKKEEKNEEEALAGLSSLFG